MSQWVWNLRLELGHRLEPTPVRTTEFAPALSEAKEQPPPVAGYGKPTVAVAFKVGRFSGRDFTLQPDGTLRCPADQKLLAHSPCREADGSLRVVYGASIHSCRSCRLREQCQWNGTTTAKPRQVSVLLRPLRVGAAPLLWRDWKRRVHRRACMQLVRQQRIEDSLSPPATASPPTTDGILSHAERAHSRLSWAERLARNARPATTGQVTIRLFGVPADFATSLGLATA